MHQLPFQITTFGWGCAGQIALEVMSSLRCLKQGKPVPKYYSTALGASLTIGSVLIGGFLAVAYGVKDNPLLSLNIGASASLILEKLSKGVRW